MKKFSSDILRDILAGGLSVMEEAGTQLLGGHSVDDPELKYGLAVTGTADPGSVVRNDTPADGDVIVLTKPLGTGLIATALKAGHAGEDVTEPFMRSMTMLNRAASEIMLRHGAHACTDVTGFGLVGHLKEMLGKNSMEITIDAKRVPVLPGARDAALGGLIPAGMYRNRDFVGDLCETAPALPRELIDILFDPQTSGGLPHRSSGRQGGNAPVRPAWAGIAEAAVIAAVKKNSSRRIVIK